MMTENISRTHFRDTQIYRSRGVHRSQHDCEVGDGEWSDDWQPDRHSWRIRPDTQSSSDATDAGHL